jgi:hypothetical protein
MKKDDDDERKKDRLQLRPWLSDDKIYQGESGTSSALTPLGGELARRRIVDEHLKKYHIP